MKNSHTHKNAGYIVFQSGGYVGWLIRTRKHSACAWVLVLVIIPSMKDVADLHVDICMGMVNNGLFMQNYCRVYSPCHNLVITSFLHSIHHT